MIYIVIHTPGHVQLFDNTQLYLPDAAYTSLDVAKDAICKRNTYGEYSHWFRQENNPEYIVHYVYETLCLPSSTKLFSTWFIVETVVQT